MAILAGIDEAGLGPSLGPLVVSGVAFRVPDEALDRCLWQTLHASCTPTPSRRGRRLPVADSKKLYSSRGSLMPLERTALVMLAVAGERPRTWRALLDAVAPEATGKLRDYPWYAETDLDLPLSPDLGDVATRSNAVLRNCREEGVTFGGAFVEPLTAGHFNRLVGRTRNKSVVAWGLTLRVVERIMKSAPNERVRLCVDRLGGRTRYREPLMTALPAYELQILEESPERSAYRMHRGDRTCEIEFVTEGESRHFVVALASVFSKYVRELYMHAFNGYWSKQIDGLRPTAGYHTDAKRWLDDASTELARRSIDRGMLVRQR